MRDIRFKEDATHGAPDFPLQYYFVNESHPRYEMDLHWHSEFEIIRVCSGELTLFVENHPCKLCAGDVAFVGGGQSHRAEPKGAVYECVVFDLNMLCRHGSGRITGYILPLLDDSVEISNLHQNEKNELCRAVDDLLGCVKAQLPYFELEAYASAARIVYLLYTEGFVKFPEKARLSSHRKDTISSLIKWIESNYTERITLQTLASVARTNEKYLCRLFKDYTGTTPIEYINRLRIERACLDLSSQATNITAVAFDSGFSDAAYFCKIFKRYKGMTPREYRLVVEEYAKK